MIKVGSIVRSKYSEANMKIVSMREEAGIAVYEAKWINESNSLSVGSLFIFGSQIDAYKEVR